MKNKILFWTTLFIIVFAVAYTATDLIVKYVMADFKQVQVSATVKGLEVSTRKCQNLSGLVSLNSEEVCKVVLVEAKNTLEVKPNYGVQNNQVYSEQPTVNPQLQ